VIEPATSGADGANGDKGATDDQAAERRRKRQQRMKKKHGRR
jgi:hypothetical protein